MSIFDDIQKKIDSVGFVSSEISSASAQEITAPVGGKEEYEWYNNQIFTGGDRKLRLNEYEEMSTYAEIGSALDIYADNATQKNEHNEVLSIFSDNRAIQKELEELFYDRICIESHLWKIVRSTCMYGDAFAELVLQQDRKGVLFLKLLPPKSMWRIEEHGRLKGFIQEVPNGAPVHFAPFEMTHFRLPSSISSYNPYGTAILESARRPWRQLKLMEDAMVVYRITRAPERRVFKVDVGNMPTAAAKQFIEKQRQTFRKRSFIDKNGQLDYRANTMAPDEDFWIAVRNGSGTDIETLGGAENLGETDDVKYFKDKIFAALKVPRVFLQDTEGIDERKSNVSNQDIMFSRTIERVQMHILEGLKKVATVHLMLRGYKKRDLDNFDLALTPSSNLAEKLELEVYNDRIGAADSLVDYGFSREYVTEMIFNMSAQEWNRIKNQRFKERIEEEKVDSGEWTPPSEGDEVIDFGKEETPEEFGVFEYITRPHKIYSKLLTDGELDQSVDKAYITEAWNKIYEEIKEVE